MAILNKLDFLQAIQECTIVFSNRDLIKDHVCLPPHNNWLPAANWCCPTESKSEIRLSLLHCPIICYLFDSWKWWSTKYHICCFLFCVHTKIPLYVGSVPIVPFYVGPVLCCCAQKLFYSPILLEPLTLNICFISWFDWLSAGILFGLPTDKPFFHFNSCCLFIGDFTKTRLQSCWDLTEMSAP